MTRCSAHGPGDERCGEPEGHEGWHHSNHHGWPNERDTLERWAEIGRHLREVGPLPHLSRKETEYALDAYERANR